MNISIDTCKKILKYAGIVMIVMALLTIALGVAATFFGVSAPGAQEGAIDENTAKGIAALLFGGASLIISGLIDLAAGIVSVKASSEAKFAKPAWIFSIISLLTSCFSAYKIFTRTSCTAGDIASAVISILLSILVCYAAYMLKKHAEIDGTAAY